MESNNNSSIDIEAVAAGGSLISNNEDNSYNDTGGDASNEAAATTRSGIETSPPALSPPTPFHDALLEDHSYKDKGGDTSNEAAATTRFGVETSPLELSPPTPFHENIDDDAIKLKSIAARSASKSNSSDQSASAASELKPPVPLPFAARSYGSDIEKKRINTGVEDTVQSPASHLAMTIPGEKRRVSLQMEESEGRKSPSNIDNTIDDNSRHSSSGVSNISINFGEDLAMSNIISTVRRSTIERSSTTLAVMDASVRRATQETIETTESNRSRNALARIMPTWLNRHSLNSNSPSEPEIHVVSATLVEENNEEVFMAERVGFFEQRSKQFAISMCLFFIVSVVVISLLVAMISPGGVNGTLDETNPDIQPSMQPSMQPSFDTRPTLEIVQDRGEILCGITHTAKQSADFMEIKLCRSVAAVVLGDSNKFVAIDVSPDDTFQQLNERSVDLTFDTHTIEREIKERTTGEGFTFSTPFFHSGMSYYGNQTYVECAEQVRRFGNCSALKICLMSTDAGFDYVQGCFPPAFLKVTSFPQEMPENLFNGTCNVLFGGHLSLMRFASNNEGSSNQYVVGKQLVTHDPLSIVTRKHDVEFSDTINWVVHALFYGEEQNITADPALCQNDANLTSRGSDLNFMNAVHCVGTYAEILFGDGVQEDTSRGMNQINNGTSMIYGTPFGDLESGDENVALIEGSTMLEKITQLRWNDLSGVGIRLNCGIVVPSDFTRDISASDKLVGMSRDYCYSLAAALFHGNYEAVEFFTFSENDVSSFEALNDGTIDVLAGGRVERKYDFESSSSSLGGFQFSTPYYYGNETASDDVSFFSLVTREEDPIFSSFVNCIVLATIYAQENDVSKKMHRDMPLVSIFGTEFSWALRDVVAYSGPYDDLYAKNFGVVNEEDRGRNFLNDQEGPQINSFSGFLSGH